MNDHTADHPIDLVSLVVRSLVLYALAEFQTGGASCICVDIGDEFSVSDNGRGHAIHRAIAGQPYLPFIYTHFDYPFAVDPPGAVQLQGIGMSLVNALCRELVVEVKKRDGSLRLHYMNGKLAEESRNEHANDATGTRVRGRVRAELQGRTTDPALLERWLCGLQRAHPRLILHFNGAVVATT